VLWRTGEVSGHVRAIIDCARAMSEQLSWLTTVGEAVRR
jgi:hypothetical protein